MALTTFQRATPQGSSEDPVADDIRNVVLDADANAPRSQQRAIGPSEIGEPCVRKLAYRIAGYPRLNHGDPWAAIVGTATHAWLADAFEADNRASGRTRWLIEQRLTIEDGVEGSCDLFDVDRLDSIDHKVIGQTNMRAYKRDGAPPGYRAQGHLYGYGWDQLGFPVNNVKLALYPRSGLLSGLFVWSEPYDRQQAIDALDRFFKVAELCARLEPANDPERFTQLPVVTGHKCTYCPWFKPGPDTGDGCPGHLTKGSK